MYRPNMKFVHVALPVPEITAIGVLGGVANLKSREKRVVGGREWYRPKERW